MKTKMKSLYLDTRVGIYLYNHPAIIATVSLALALAAIFVAAACGLALLHLTALGYTVCIALVWAAVLVTAGVLGSRSERFVIVTQERWIAERATPSAWQLAHQETR